MPRNLLKSAILMVLLPLSADAQPGATSVAPVVDGCEAMEIGPVYDASLNIGATLSCFQFVTPEVPATVKIDVHLAGFLPGELHDVSLVRVDLDGTTAAAASDASTDAFRVLQAIGHAPARWLLLVGRPAVDAVEPFQMQVTISGGADGHEPNDAIAQATKLDGNQQIEGSLDNANDIDNYLFSFRAGQREAIVELEAPAGVIGDVVDGADRTGVLEAGKRYRIDTSRPVFIRLRGDANTIGARYKLMLRDPEATAVVTAVRSGENISHLAPGAGISVPGGANAARKVDVEAQVFEGDGSTPAGPGYVVEFISLDTGSNNSRWILTKSKVTTDASGIARAALDIGPCKGGVLGPISVPTRGNPPDHWDIEYNPYAYVVAVVEGSDASSAQKNRPMEFQHICREKFRMHRPARLGS